MNRPLAGALRIWLPVAVALLVLSALVYGAVQHDLRSSADDPQIQMAQDAAASLGSGVSPRSVAGAPSVDVARSLAPFVVVFDLKGNPVASSGLLDKKAPTLPAGVLDSARSSGEDRVTWSPRSDVRIASVIVPYKNGYVMAGRSLREVERREDDVLHLALLACLVGLIASALAALSAAIATSRRPA